MNKLISYLIIFLLAYSCSRQEIKFDLFNPLKKVPKNLTYSGYEREWGVDVEMYFKKGPDYIHGIQVDSNQILLQYWIVPVERITNKDDLLKRLNLLKVTTLQSPSINSSFAVLSYNSNIQMMCRPSTDTLHFFYHTPY